MDIDDIKRVLILGSGTMGQQIGYVCALHGFNVVIYDIADEILEKAKPRIEKLPRKMGLYGQFGPDDFNAALTRISYTSDPETAAKDIDLISESVPENPELKGNVFAQFHKLCKPDTIFTTNTSTLLPSVFAEATGRPEKLCALHFHVVNMTTVVDIMPHPGTSPQTISLVAEFARKIGQTPIVMKKEQNGYVYNYMLMALLESALTLVSKGVVSHEDVDRAWMGVMHTPIGPFGIMDGIGLSTVFTVNDYWAKMKNDPKAMANAALLKTFVDQGKLGTKSGQGFYAYPKPAYANPDFLKRFESNSETEGE